MVINPEKAKGFHRWVNDHVGEYFKVCADNVHTLYTHLYTAQRKVMTVVPGVSKDDVLMYGKNYIDTALHPDAELEFDNDFSKFKIMKSVKLK